MTSGARKLNRGTTAGETGWQLVQGHAAMI